jgi:hypothetical protein
LAAFSPSVIDRFRRIDAETDIFDASQKPGKQSHFRRLRVEPRSELDGENTLTGK